MRSPDESPSTRDKILAAAVRRFGTDGFGASLRAIATDAGVSAALIIKIFSSKENLRTACDAYVLGIVDAAKKEAMRSQDLRNTFLSQMATFEQYQPLVHYIVRNFFEGGEMTRRLLVDMHTQAREWMADGVAAGHLKPSRNENLRVMLTFSISIGWIMQAIVLSGKDLSDLDAGFWIDMEHDMMRAALEIYTEGLLTEPTMLEEYLLYLGDPPPGATGSADAAGESRPSGRPEDSE
ncbi:TetR family transcriptional regulator [Actinomycetaceae bacterium L2_0104]